MKNTETKRVAVFKSDFKDKKIAIISSCFRPEISDSLVKNCLATLYDKGLSDQQIDIIEVPGALEIPLVAKKVAKRGQHDAIIVFGSVLKGDTYHFEQVADECARGCMNVSYDFEIPVVFQVLCVYKLEDALERANGTNDNRGVEGALTALEMIETVTEL
jgi:6,7-dimethyl-8-ribityllumazine synthase